MQAEVTDLIEEGGRVVGVRADDAGRRRSTVRATLVVGADGRASTVRERAGLEVEDLGAPIDVLWMRLSRRDERRRRDARPHRRRQDAGDARPRRLLAVRLRDPEGRGRGGQGARASRRSAPAIVAGRAADARPRRRSSRAGTTSSCSPSQVDRLAQWHRPGLLCIGDAAHAMSPVGGVGINLAVQDAVAAANRLAAPLRAGTVSDADLAAVQRRRMFPTRVTQRMQVFMQNNVLSRVLAGRDHAGAAVAGAAGQPLSDAAAHSGAAGRARRPSRACAGFTGQCASHRALDKRPASLGAIPI